MKETLIVIGVILSGVAMRSVCNKLSRRLGMLCYIAATALIGYFSFDSWIGALAGVLLWILFPWLELFFSVRKAKLPLKNKLCKGCLPCKSYFPESDAMVQHFQDLGYEHLSDCGWQWDKSKEHYCVFWHSEKKQMVSICHRIQSCVTFSYLNICSRAVDGTIFRSTNFPFSASLPAPPTTKFNHITDGNISCPEHVIYAHELFLFEAGIDLDHLAQPDTDQIEEFLEKESQDQIRHNLTKGLIKDTGDGHFSYSFKGLFYLWRQILKDMFRLC